MRLGLRHESSENKSINKALVAHLDNNNLESEDFFLENLLKQMAAQTSHDFESQLELFSFGYMLDVYDHSQIDIFIDKTQRSLLPKERIKRAQSLYKWLILYPSSPGKRKKHLDKSKNNVTEIWQEAIEKTFNPFAKIINRLEFVTQTLPKNTEYILTQSAIELGNIPNLWDLHKKNSADSEIIARFIRLLPTLIHLSRKELWKDDWQQIITASKQINTYYSEPIELAILSVLTQLGLTDTEINKFIQKLEKRNLSDNGLLQLALHKIKSNPNQPIIKEYNEINDQEIADKLSIHTIAYKLAQTQDIAVTQELIKHFTPDKLKQSQLLVSSVLHACELGVDIPWDDTRIILLLYGGAFDTEMFRLVLYSREITRGYEADEIKYSLFNQTLTNRLKFLAHQLKYNKIPDQKRQNVEKGIGALAIDKETEFLPQIELSMSKTQLFEMFEELETERYTTKEHPFWYYFGKYSIAEKNVDVDLRNFTLISEIFREYMTNDSGDIGTEIAYFWYELLQTNFKEQTKFIAQAQNRWQKEIENLADPIKKVKDLCHFMSKTKTDMTKEIEAEMKIIYEQLPNTKLGDIVALFFAMEDVAHIEHVNRLHNEIITYFDKEDLSKKNSWEFRSLVHYVRHTKKLDKNEKIQYALRAWKQMLELESVKNSTHALSPIANIIVNSGDFAFFEEVLFSKHLKDKNKHRHKLPTFEHKQVLEELVYKAIVEENQALLDRAREYIKRLDVPELNDDFLNYFSWYLSAKAAVEKNIFAFNIPEVRNMLETGRADLDLDILYDVVKKFPEKTWFEELFNRRALQAIINHNQGLEKSVGTSKAKYALIYFMKKMKS